MYTRVNNMSTLALTPPLSGYSSAGIQSAFDKTGTNAGQKLKYDEVHFSPGQYILNSRMYLNSDTKITCDPGVIWKLEKTNFGQLPLVGQKESTISGLDISGIQYDGQYPIQTDTPNDHGLGYGNFINLLNVKNSKFHDLKGGHNEGDILRLQGGDNIEIYNCNITEPGHTFTFLQAMSNVSAHDNYIEMRADNAFRVKESNRVKVFRNRIKGTPQAYSDGIQIERISENPLFSIEIFENIITDTYGPAINAFSTLPNNNSVNIHNNLISRCGQMPHDNKLPGVGGIIFDGIEDIKIWNNTIVDCFGYGVAATQYIAQASTAKNLKALVQRNIITGTKVSNYAGSMSGSGIADLSAGRYSITSQENCLFKNLTPYCKITSASDIYVDPLFTDPTNGDYHLQSKPSMPCVFHDYELGAFNGVTGAAEFIPPDLPCVCIPQGDEEKLKVLCQELLASGFIKSFDCLKFSHVSKDFEV